MRSLTILSLIVVALAAPWSASASPPVRTTSAATFSMVDEETCAFALDVTVERTRTTTVFANGDITRHVALTVTTAANGKTLVERDSFNVFIDHTTPSLWVITGRFGQWRTDAGGPVVVRSGRILYDLTSDTVLDPHPHGGVPDVCDVLAP